VEQWSRTIVRDHYVYRASLHDQHEQFAKQWDNNLRLQGFAKAFERQKSATPAQAILPAFGGGGSTTL
jgi:hypothetical protein